MKEFYIEKEELLWLAGLLEGEGAFCKAPPSKPNGPVLSLEMTDRDVVEKVSKLFGKALHIIKPRKINHKTSYKTMVKGTTAIAWMTTLEPYLFARRREQIRLIIERYDPTLKCRSKLSIDLKDEILAKLKTRSLRSVAKDYNVSREMIRRCKRIWS